MRTPQCRLSFSQAPSLKIHEEEEVLYLDRLWAVGYQDASEPVQVRRSRTFSVGILASRVALGRFDPLISPHAHSMCWHSTMSGTGEDRSSYIRAIPHIPGSQRISVPPTCTHRDLPSGMPAQPGFPARQARCRRSCCRSWSVPPKRASDTSYIHVKGWSVTRQHLVKFFSDLTELEGCFSGRSLHLSFTKCRIVRGGDTRGIRSLLKTCQLMTGPYDPAMSAKRAKRSIRRG